MSDLGQFEKATQRVQAQLRDLRSQIEKETQPWFSPDCRQAVKQSCTYLLKAETKLSKIPYLIEHGAKKKAAKMIRQTRELYNVSKNCWNMALTREERFRIQIAQEVMDA